MSWSAATVAAGFLAFAGVALAAWATVLCARSLVHCARARGTARAAAEAQRDRMQLLWLVLAVLLATRGLAWAGFYAVLDGYVPALADLGVMCAYGVTLVLPVHTAALELAKPLVLFALGAWLLASEARRHGASPAPRGLVISAALVALAAGAECAGELAYLARPKTGTPVTCCTEFVEPGATLLGRASGAGALGIGSARGALPLASLAMLATTALLAYATSRAARRADGSSANRAESPTANRAQSPTASRSERQPLRRAERHPESRSQRGSASRADGSIASRAGSSPTSRAVDGPPATRLAPRLALALASASSLAASAYVWHAELAPRVLGLPYHRCVYELVTDTPALGLAAGLTAFGHACLAWPLALHGSGDEATARALERRVLRAGAWALASAATIVAVHVA